MILRRLAVGAALVAALSSGCAGKPSITVGSGTSTEQTLLGEIAAQQLERRLDVSVARRLDFAGSVPAHEALVAGQIDLVPEYTGTALTAVLKLPVEADPRAVYDRVAAEYRSRWTLVWLPPLGFSDTFRMAIRGSDSRATGITTLSEAALRKDAWTLGVDREFAERPDGMPALQGKYALPLYGMPRTMDRDLLYKALHQKQVDMVVARSTDGLLSTNELDVKLLEDDRRGFPPYEAAFVVREACLAKEPRVREALQELSGKLTEVAMQKLNHQVDRVHRRAASVAKEFLDGLGDARAAR